MIGVIHIEREPRFYLDEILEILCTPWELQLHPRFIEQWKTYVATHFGKAESERFVEACNVGNLKSND